MKKDRFRGEYCEECGEKNKLCPLNRFDGKTGERWGEYVCQNSTCSEGKEQRQSYKTKICKHEIRLWIFSCKKCGFWGSSGGGSGLDI